MYYSVSDVVLLYLIRFFYSKIPFTNLLKMFRIFEREIPQKCFLLDPASSVCKFLDLSEFSAK